MTPEQLRLVHEFEKGFESFDALHTLADRHESLPKGVIDYWNEKLGSIENDMNLLKENAHE